MSDRLDRRLYGWLDCFLHSLHGRWWRCCHGWIMQQEASCSWDVCYWYAVSLYQQRAVVRGFVAALFLFISRSSMLLCLSLHFGSFQIRESAIAGMVCLSIHTALGKKRWVRARRSKGKGGEKVTWILIGFLLILTYVAHENCWD